MRESSAIFFFKTIYGENFYLNNGKVYLFQFFLFQCLLLQTFYFIDLLFLWKIQMENSFMKQKDGKFKGKKLICFSMENSDEIKQFNQTIIPLSLFKYFCKFNFKGSKWKDGSYML